MNKIAFLVLALSFNANADVLGQPQVSAGPVVVTVPDGTVIPMLDVVFDCGSCKPDNKMKALIQGAYLDQAELEKAKVDESKMVIYKISQFNSRGKARFLLGALAGRDHIAGQLDCNGMPFNVSDSAISAVNGIESVALNVGQDAYKAALSCILNQSNKAE